MNQASPGIALASSSNPVFFSNSITFTATLSGAGTSAAPPGGSVTFLDGTTQLGTAAIVNGTASFVISTLTAGTHSISAACSGDTNYAKVTSATLAEVIDNFTIAPPSGGSTSAAAQPGGQAVYTLAFTPPSGQTFPAAINLAVTGIRRFSESRLKRTPFQFLAKNPEY